MNKVNPIIGKCLPGRLIEKEYAASLWHVRKRLCPGLRLCDPRARSQVKAIYCGSSSNRR
jgi:hypothetical protein